MYANQETLKQITELYVKACRLGGAIEEPLGNLFRGLMTDALIVAQAASGETMEAQWILDRTAGPPAYRTFTRYLDNDTLSALMGIANAGKETAKESDA